MRSQLNKTKYKVRDRIIHQEINRVGIRKQFVPFNLAILSNNPSLVSKYGFLKYSDCGRTITI